MDDALVLAEAAGLEDGTPMFHADGSPKAELTPRRVPVGIVGFDIRITLPKSVSLLLAFPPDELIDRGGGRLHRRN